MMKQILLIFAGFIILGLEASSHEEKSSGCDDLNPVLGKTTVLLSMKARRDPIVYMFLKFINLITNSFNY